MAAQWRAAFVGNAHNSTFGRMPGWGSLLVVTGPPGSGKSTLAAALAARLDRSVLIEGDTFFGFLRTGAIEPWRPEADRQNTVVTYAAGAAAGQYREAGSTPSTKA